MNIDKLTDSDGKVMFIESVNTEVTDEAVYVYNFQVEGTHTYYVSDECILVHNADVDYSDLNISKGGLNSLDDIFTQGKKVFDNFDIETAYVKPKHLSTTGGNGQKFIGASKAEAESILKDVLSNGTITSITDNGLTKAGNVSYEIIIDAGKIIGTKGENMVKIVLSSDGGMLSAYPIK